MHRGTPSRRYVPAYQSRNGLTGATANGIESPRHGDGEHFTYGNNIARGFTANSRYSRAAPASQTFAYGGDHGSQSNNLFMRDTSFLDSSAEKIVDPVPVLSFINRLHDSQRLTMVPTMKQVNNLPKSLRESFGDKEDDWYAYINLSLIHI